MTPPSSQDQPIPTPRCNLAFDGDLSVGLQPEIKTWEEAKKFSRTLEKELWQAQQTIKFGFSPEQFGALQSELTSEKEKRTEQRMQFNSQILEIQSERDKLRQDLQLTQSRLSDQETNLQNHRELIVSIGEERDKLRKALESLLKRYVSLVNCGDCGNWNPEEEPDVINSREALSNSPAK